MKTKEIKDLKGKDQLKQICEELARVVITEELDVSKDPDKLVAKISELYGLNTYSFLGSKLRLNKEGDFEATRTEVFQGCPVTLLGLITITRETMLTRMRQQEEMRGVGGLMKAMMQAQSKD